jgi:hypothetical protein
VILFFRKVIIDKILITIKVNLNKIIIALSKTHNDGIVLANGFSNNQDKVFFDFSIVFNLY